jgi:uroporphyrinogen-III synthase
VEELSARLSALESRLAQATAAPPVPAQPSPPNPADAQVANLEAHVAALENAVASERARANRAEDEARQIGARLRTVAREAAALAHLGTNLERGYPFEREYDDATAAFGSDSRSAARLAPLRQWAESGIPTRAALREALETQGGDIVRASILGDATTWWQAIVAHVKALIVARPTPDGDIPAAGTPEGDRAPAIVARAEARLRDGDVAGALSELSSLSGTAADTAQAWIAAARARMAADEAMAALEESLRTFASAPQAAPTTQPVPAAQSAPPAEQPAAKSESSAPAPVDTPDSSHDSSQGAP